MTRHKRLLKDLAADIQEHLDRETQDNVARGMSPEEARHAARRKFGNVSQVMEETREVWIARWKDNLLQDLRFAFRMLHKNPGFTAIAVLTLALGIGANTAIFSVVYNVLLKPLPFPHPEQLIFLSEAKPQSGISAAGLPYDNFTEIRAQSSAFTGLGGVATHELTFTGRGEPTVADIASVTPELFSVLATKPILGRVFVPDDGKLGAAPVVLLSESVWRNLFASDPGVLGSSVNLDHRPFTVVGVIPTDTGIILAPRRIQFWIPVVQDPLFSAWIPRQGLRWLGVIGRLSPGISVPKANAEMDAVASHLAVKFPVENSGWSIQLVSLQHAIVGDVRTPLLVLLGSVGLVLLIACANISNLLLARATSRGKEVALRTALGAGRARIVRQLLTESTVLGLLGGVIGILLAYWGVHTLTSFLPGDIPQVHAIGVDASVLLFALALSVFASLLFGLAPALFAARHDVQAILKDSAAHSSEPGVRRFARSLLAAAELALAVVLLVAAGLFLRSFSSLTSVNPGFNTAHVVRAAIQLPQYQYSKPEQWIAFSDELINRLQSQPGMSDSAVGIPLPLDPQGAAILPFEIFAHPPLPKGTPETADFVSISPAYFHVMEIPLLRGRIFNERDDASASRVTIINQAFARRFLQNEDPIGQQLVFSFPPSPGVPRQIVGIVGDVRNVSIGQDPGPMMYVPFDQSPLWGAEVVVRSDRSLPSLVSAIRQQVHDVDKDLPVTEIGPMSESVGASVAQPRFRTWLLGSFAGMALVLAAIGIFGVVSYSVSRRTQEIGIRMALGASRSAILRIISRETLVMLLAGLAVGIPIALASSRLLGHLLFGVSFSDPITLVSVTLALLAVAALASWIPARRATRVDPLVALRHE